MLPISPIAAAFGLMLFLSRTNIAGLIGGGIVGMALMHLWPDIFMPIYEWVGRAIEAAGLDTLVSDVETDMKSGGQSTPE